MHACMHFVFSKRNGHTCDPVHGQDPFGLEVFELAKHVVVGYFVHLPPRLEFLQCVRVLLHDQQLQHFSQNVDHLFGVVVVVVVVVVRGVQTKK